MSQTVQRKENKLAKEKSPYLLQHKNNPVNWFPWSDEAFLRAKAEDKPIFLSIGYSTCHWCHVMERESFEDEMIAEILNENFVAIKVDREERPDIDTVYMNVCQIISGSGGWPLNIFLTPDKKPFYAGTYFPKESRYGITGLADLLKNIAKLWNDNKDELLNKSNEITNFLKAQQKGNEQSEIEKNVFDKTFEQFLDEYDNEYGGFGDAPKFPSAHQLLYLLRYYKFYNKQEAFNMCLDTLKSMYKGGIYDHIGGGFARYSTDKIWLVPHFEKMLYDNALLLMAYTDAYAITKDCLYKDIAKEIVQFVLRDMTDEKGGFHSAIDADSEGVEGKYYVWSYDEIIEILGESDAKMFSDFYGISKRGNFEGSNIPNLIKKDITEFNDPNIKDKLNKCKNKLLQYRTKRIAPHKDDKILTAWNGLMIAALANAGKVLEEKSYIEMAEKAIKFIENNLFRDDGRLLIRFRENESKNLALLDDYAFLVWGLIETYEATLETKYLDIALRLNSDMINIFEDSENGGFFLYGEDNEILIMKPKEIYDGAMMSGNSVAAYNLLRLSRMIDDSLIKNYEALLMNFSTDINNSPRHTSFLLISLIYYYNKSRDIVIASSNIDKPVNDFINQINKEFSSYFTLLLNNDSMKDLNKEMVNKKMINDKPTVYICEGFSCIEPSTDLNKVLDNISNTDYS
nr:thioredoxin domain-containing protein [Abyssisolibacter fermentans]